MRRCSSFRSKSASDFSTLASIDCRMGISLLIGHLLEEDPDPCDPRSSARSRRRRLHDARARTRLACARRHAARAAGRTHRTRRRCRVCCRSAARRRQHQRLRPRREPRRQRHGHANGVGEHRCRPGGGAGRRGGANGRSAGGRNADGACKRERLRARGQPRHGRIRVADDRRDRNGEPNGRSAVSVGKRPVSGSCACAADSDPVDTCAGGRNAAAA